MNTRVLVMTALLLSAAAGAEAQPGRAAPSLPPPAAWERIPLRYIDVRILTAAAGAPNLPTEWDLYRMRMGGFGMQAPTGGGGFGLFGNLGVIGDPNSNALLVGPAGMGRLGAGAGPQQGNAGGGFILGDPGSNSLLGGFRSGPPRR